MKVRGIMVLKEKAQKGFTLIELLVVIGILGILASALVATIDPFEQLKKAQDANVKNILVEFNDATIRYFATHNAYPWTATGTGGGGCDSAQVATGPQKLALYSGGAVSDCVTVLEGDNELKQSYGADVGDLSKIFITYDAGNNLVIGCFQPQSKSGQNDANTQFNKDGTVNTTKSCTTQSDTNGCFWCTR